MASAGMHSFSTKSTSLASFCLASSEILLVEIVFEKIRDGVKKAGVSRLIASSCHKRLCSQRARTLVQQEPRCCVRRRDDERYQCISYKLHSLCCHCLRCRQHPCHRMARLRGRTTDGYRDISSAGHDGRVKLVGCNVL